MTEHILKRGQILDRKYKIEKYLGGGAFGEVYRVKNTFLKKRFAIKVFKVSLEVKGSESTVQDLLDEAVLLARFDHRNIVKVHDAGTFITDAGDEHVFFVMDFIPGGDLHDYWVSFGSKFIPLDNVIDIIKQICEGLNILHSEIPPMIHRDIKPQNIMIGYDDHGIVAKLTDFGLVKAVNPTTLYASARGTLAFKAPEFLEGKDDTSTDIFAVGVTFYMLLTDKFPYPTDNEFDVMTGSWLKNKPKPLNYYNPLIYDEKLESIVFKAISTNPEDRYKNAKELLDAIVEWENTKDEEQPVEKVEIIESPSDESENKSDSQEIQQDSQDDETVDSGTVEQTEVSKPEKPSGPKNPGKHDASPQDIMFTSDAFRDVIHQKRNEKKQGSESNPEEKIPSIPPEECISKALKAVSNFMDYRKGIDFLQQAFDQKPELKEEYGEKFDLWKCFVLIQDHSTVDEGIDNLKRLAHENSSVGNDYNFALDILSGKDTKKMEKEALNYIDINDTEKGSILMELAMLMDKDIKNRYQYSLKNWKNGIIN